MSALTYVEVLEQIARSVRSALMEGAFEGTLFESHMRGLLWLVGDQLPPAPNTESGSE